MVTIKTDLFKGLEKTIDYAFINFSQAFVT